MALGRIGSAVIVGMVLLVTLWFVALPFGLAGLWWQHHWGLGPFDVLAWLDGQWTVLGAEAVSVLVSIVLVVGLAGRFRRWWLIAGPVIVGIGALFAFTQGYLVGAVAHPLHDKSLTADARRLERVEGVQGTPLGVEDVSAWTDQANAYTAGFGPSSQVVLWDTLLDGRFTRGEERVVIAHELGHVKSRHILKAIGWSALIVLPTLWLLALATRRRGGMGRAENVPFAVLVLTLLSLLTTPVQNAVSRRYEAEADWRALSATQRPAVGDAPLPQLPADEPRGAEPAALGLPVAREPPDADAAPRDGAAVAGGEAAGAAVTRPAMSRDSPLDTTLSVSPTDVRSRAGPGCP